MDAPSVSQQEVTDLLARWSQGDDAGEAIDLNRLATLMHAEYAWGAATWWYSVMSKSSCLCNGTAHRD